LVDPCEVAGAIRRSRLISEFASRHRFGSYFGHPGALLVQGNSRRSQRLAGAGLHATRVNSLCDATLGVLHSGSLAVCTIGQGLAAARSLKPKHAIKQVDRLLSNPAINVDDILVRWVPFVIGARDTIVVAMDWTDFDATNRPPSWWH
jgi:hypothetical protein